MKEYKGHLPRIPNTYKKGKVSDAIITFDIETTSLFHYKDGWRCFRPKLPPSAYEDIEKAALPYIWMIGIETAAEDVAIYGRDFMQLGEVFRKIGGNRQKRVIWVHNLGWEFQFLRDVIEEEGWTVEKMLASAARKPICFYIPEINIEFRCSYRLTGLSLAKAAEQYTNIRKASGDLIYTVPRSPLTPLNAKELYYCEMDVLTLIGIIKFFRREYDHISRIPYTQTGEVRRELKSYMDKKTIYKIADMVPDEEIYLTLMRAFQGGLVHASYLHVNKVIKNVLSGDMASAYPASMVAFKYPMSRWLRIPWQTCEKLNPENWAVLYHVRFLDIQSKLINRYILRSKIIRSGGDITSDNGRLIFADDIEMMITEQDMIIIKQAYSIGEIVYIDTYCNRKDWLPKPIIEYILMLYGQKTQLKNIKGKEEIYMKSKQRINSIFGCCVTSVLNQTTIYDNGEWSNRVVNHEFIEEKLEELRKSKSNCFSYSWGIYVTAYTRARTWGIVSSIDAAKVGIDKGAIYYDTDSCKARDSEEFRAAMAKSNEDIKRRMMQMCNDLGIDPARLAPLDPDGIAHHLGLWEIDAEYREIKTLGCKRYAHRSKKTNRLNITVSGVNSKKGRKALKDDIRNFKKNLIFDYNTAGKNISVYNDKQPVFTFKDCNGVEYTSTQKHGIVLQPTTYNMTVDPLFEALWETDMEGRIYINE